MTDARSEKDPLAGIKACIERIRASEDPRETRAAALEARRLLEACSASSPAVLDAQLSSVAEALRSQVGAWRDGFPENSSCTLSLALPEDILERASLLGLDRRFLDPDSGQVHSTLETASPETLYDLSGLGVFEPDTVRLKEHRWKLLEGEGRTPLERAARFLEPGTLASLFDRHMSELVATRRAMIQRNRLPHALAIRAAVLSGQDYDSARSGVMDLLRGIREERDAARQLADLLFPELAENIGQLMLDHRHAEPGELPTLFGGEQDSTAFLKRLEDKLREIVEIEGPGSEAIYRDAVRTWEDSILSEARAIEEANRVWAVRYESERKKLFDDPLLDDVRSKLTPEEVHSLVRHLFPRLYDDVPHLVDLRAPLILLVGGATGTGKSTIARLLSERLGIHLYFSADILREVQRGVTTPESHPALHRSSFHSKPLLTGFFEQAMRISEAVEAVIRRLSREGVSAVIEGVPLVPGFLPEDCYEAVNVVHIVVAVPDADSHAERFRARAEEAASRGLERYMAELPAIREIQDALCSLSRATGGLHVENDDLERSVSLAEAWVKCPFVDRFRPPRHPAVEEAIRRVAERKACAQAPARAAPGALPPASADPLFDGLEEGERTAIEALGRGRAKRLGYRYAEDIGRSERAFLDVRTILFDWVRRLSRTAFMTYDEARRRIAALALDEAGFTVDALERLFLPRDRQTLRHHFIRDGATIHLGDEGLERVENLGDMEDWVRARRGLRPGLMDRYLFWIQKRREAVREEVERARARLGDVRRLRGIEDELLRGDPEVLPFLDRVAVAQVRSLVRKTALRLREGTPRAKEPVRPTLILLGGAPATGKRSVALALKQALAIPTSLRTDLVREVMRGHLDPAGWEELHSSALALTPEGEERFHREYLELFYRPKDLIDFKDRWRKTAILSFMRNAAATFSGVELAVSRLVKENQSAVIEGPAVLPGALPDAAFKEANIVQALLCVEDEHEHYRRFIDSGLPRDAFLSTRFIHNELKAMARSAGIQTVNNEDLEAATATVVRAAAGAKCDRPRRFKHPLVEEIMSDVKARLPS